MIDPKSKYNLMRQEDIWNEEVYSMSAEESGICYTYNPPFPSQPGEENKFLAYLGNREEVVIEGYYLYLHEKDQLWPKLDLNMIGQSERLQVNLKEVLGGNFKVKEIQYISK